ncbi:MAG: branched-chain amino acid ABC transporter substrate-binding protein [Bacillota bacterium]
MKMKTGLTVLLTAAIVASLLSGFINIGSAADSLTVIKIATQSPLSGGSAVQGEAVKLGAQMSLNEHKAEFEKLGFRLQLVPYDDQGDPATGVLGASLIGADPAILGVVGHLNSGVSIPSSVVYEKYSVTMVSPASTAAELTDRHFKTVNRLVPRDDIQGPAAAEYAVKTVGAKNIFVIQDKTAYGRGLADAFIGEAKKLGATIVGCEGITIGDKDFSGVINQAFANKPDLIFFGGLYAEGGLLIKQARERGITVPFMGGDGLHSSGIADFAGDAIEGTFYSSPVMDIAQTDRGKQWAEAYKQTFGKNPENLSAFSYDSMTVLLNGLKKAIRENGGSLPSREQVRDAVRGTQDFQGIATKVSFDSKGDNTFAEAAIYQFD